MVMSANKINSQINNLPLNHEIYINNVFGILRNLNYKLDSKSKYFTIGK